MQRWRIAFIIGALIGSGTPAMANQSGTKTLTPGEAQQLVHEDPGGRLRLNDLECICGDTAAVLSHHDGPLYLDGLITIDPDIAEALAKHEGLLTLNGLTSLSEETAACLKEHAGPLHLNGLSHLEEGVASRLSEHLGGEISLEGLETLAPNTAEILARYPGHVYLRGLKRMSRLAYHKILMTNVRLPAEFIIDRTHDVIFLSGMGFGQPMPPTFANWVQAIQNESGADIRIDRKAFAAAGLDPETLVSPRLGEYPMGLDDLLNSLAATISGDRIGVIVVDRKGSASVFTSGSPAPAAEPKMENR